MSLSNQSPEQVGVMFSDQWWSNDVATPQVYDDLLAKLADMNYVTKCDGRHIDSAVLACQHVLENVPKGGRILEMACGIGSVASCLSTLGYEVEAFDISVAAIERAKQLAQNVGQPPEMFSLADQDSLSEMPDSSFDAVLAIGLFRYLNRAQQEKAYRNINRILKPGGKFVITQENTLFNAFAMNDGTITFWAELVDGHSDGRRLLDGKTSHDAINGNVTVPQRVYDPVSVSRRMEVQADNPLIFDQLIGEYGFRLERILYPNSNIFPPAVESSLDQDALSEFKKEVSLQRADDWRSIFMAPQFEAFAEKE